MKNAQMVQLDNGMYSVFNGFKNGRKMDEFATWDKALAAEVLRSRLKIAGVI